MSYVDGGVSTQPKYNVGVTLFFSKYECSFTISVVQILCLEIRSQQMNYIFNNTGGHAFYYCVFAQSH